MYISFPNGTLFNTNYPDLSGLNTKQTVYRCGTLADTADRGRLSISGFIDSLFLTVSCRFRTVDKKIPENLNKKYLKEIH
jgi:hypothetical protein